MNEIKITKENIRVWLETAPDKFHYKEVFEGQIDPEKYGRLRQIMHEFAKEKVIKRVDERGWYKRVELLKPVNWRDADETKYFDLAFPKSHEDDTYFGFQDTVKLSPGSLVIVVGSSNAGKSSFVLNVLGENVDKHKCILMGNEYAKIDKTASPQFKRRMLNMKWAQWTNGEGNDKFEMIPADEDYETYIQKDCVNIIDWIYLTKDWFTIGKILKDIKKAVGDGLAIVVLQKKRGMELAYGQEMTEHFADLYLNIDFFDERQSMLTVGKVKEKIGRATGRMWRFTIVDYGANFHEVIEIAKCHACFGKGYRGSGNNYKRCDVCGGKKYIDVSDFPL